MSIPVPAYIHVRFAKLRSDYLNSLRSWEQSVQNNRNLKSYDLSQRLIKLTDHIGKNFLIPEILRSTRKPFCFRTRVDSIINILLDTIEMLHGDRYLVNIAPGFLAHILRMVSIQIGRLTLVTGRDDMTIASDRSANAMDASARIGDFGACDALQRQVLTGVWKRLHFAGKFCDCGQCSLRRLMDVDVSMEKNGCLVTDGSMEIHMAAL
ncbi:hypothetical protein N7520_003705 [Penicillium odoratum]|uniref:uncharacterized protein n=1 Tax=Penicillium odoratum TaxID=1167516 RepID=UPI0025499682|nr:uncharacterized protein N7520_003705 [Penicillium odoratum]KAJ5769146.1 hypothetical protein N7520_003705 [Penicillium odoratum]